MTEQTTQIPNLYALLIGIDYYLPGKLPDGSFYPSLGGCVRDIKRVEDYLKKTQKPKQIFKLTSSNTDATEPPEPQDQLPTYENIVAKFHAITEIAQKDDQVYIHYSGHGGRAKTIYPELKGAGQPDEALVPMDIAKTNQRYLRDVEIATLLKKMVNKGLVVTVVFDSCHSGGTTRGDTAIRGLEGEPDTTSRPTDSLVASRQELIQNWLELTGGTARKANAGDWLPKSRDYVLLAACRPSEYAFESVFNGNESNGALTYWMLDTLNNPSPDLTYKSLYDRVYAKVQSQFQTQTPMLFGEGERQVFGRSYANVHYTVNVLKVDTARNRVQLDAGIAQGLGEGARFAIYAPGTTDFSEKNKPLAIAQVTADITPGDAWAAIEPDSRSGDIEQASPAIMLSAPIALVRRVRLFEKQEDTTNQLPKNQVLPSELLKIQTTALTAVKAAIPRIGKGWVELVSKGEHYQVAINTSGEYEICDRNGTPYPNLRPALLVGDADAAENVVKRLVHLTKYQAVQELENLSVLTNKLVVQLTDKDKKPLADPTKQTLQTGENTFLYIKNESDQDLNVVVMDLQSDWAISQFDILEDGASFVPFAPGQEEWISLSFKLPEGYQEGKDILKVFATVGPAKFRWLELPSLDKPIQARNAAFDEYDENTPRGGGDPLDKLLEAISADPDEIPPTREVQVMASNRGWTTKTVTITVKAN
ncbi:peptidase C14 caspase catalytic subunit p20 [Tolypothrix sp. NIES-4075]|uniref:caspase family protein n=1 Tax=Tolypothrix sp. NIES-4075 TaxID=2005459 RepID=UPI000B5C1D75|nr:caspase family protein [Tolypothrix sp. NIES-4075]GAX40371.1 peptidase C14 caspase catalytic subunit p20 [Tolypothrix sp. NIES-4075]